MPKLVRLTLIAPVFASLLALGCDFEPRKTGIPATQARSAAQTKTMDDMRQIGQALVSWQEAKVSQGSSGMAPPPCEKVSYLEGPNADRMFELGKIPHASWEEMNAELVPGYLRELPREDGWGKAYDFRVNLANPNCPDAISLRSAGADGSFGYAHYLKVGFDPADDGQDLVWASGDFVRIPDPSMAKKN